jgi:hypothetical protein
VWSIIQSNHDDLASHAGGEIIAVDMYIIDEMPLLLSNELTIKVIGEEPTSIPTFR